MKNYLDLVQRLVDLPDSELKPNRTGMSTKAISGYMLEHDMSQGFPIITTRKMYMKNAAIELEFFLRGKTDKKWLQDRGNSFWDNWANPLKAPYGTDDISKQRMKNENDLGPIYGYQWRNFNGKYIEPNLCQQGYDQVKSIVNKLHNDPTDRRMICSAWNPVQLNQMALPPCHLLFQVVVTGSNLDTLNLNWYQRSCDTMIGIPYDLMLYGLLLELFAAEAGMKPGKLCGMLGDVHIYENHIKGAKEQLKRTPIELPKITVPYNKPILDWTYGRYELRCYKHHEPINFSISV